MYNIKKIILFFTIFLPCLTHTGSKGSKSANVTKNKTKTSTIFFQNNKWYVYIPRSAETHCFSTTQIAKIIESMPLDMKASVLCDAKNLDRVLDFIENNNITPDIVPNTNFSDNSKSTVSPSWQAIMDRARSYHSTSDRERYMHKIHDFSTDRVFSLYYKASKQGLANMRAETVKELSQHSSSSLEAIMLKELLVQIDQASRCPRFAALYFIKHANLDAAIDTYRNLPGRMPIEILNAAKKILEARSDYQQRLVHNALNSYQVVYQPKFLEVQPMVVEALNPNHDLGMVTQKLGITVDQVYANADKYNYVIPHEIDLEIQSSLDTLSEIKTAKEFTFEVAKIQHLLCDVQEQTIVSADLKPNIVERSPDLLTRAIQEYWKDLAPTESEISFISDLACYISDVTIGTSYLAPEIVEQRIQGFWNGIDKLSFENLAQMTTEEWVDASAYVAARATWAISITKTAAVLRNLKNVCTALSGTAASFADKFVKIFDNVIGSSPTIITAEGTVIVNASPILVAEAAQALYSLNDMEGDKPEIIKSVDGVLDKQAEINQKDLEFFENIKEPLNELTKDSNTMKEIGEMAFKESHTFSPKHKAKGIMNLGKTTEEIVRKFIEVIGIADIKNKLAEGDNPIWTCINGHQVEITVNIKDGIVRSINGFIRYSSKNADKAIRV